MRPSMSALGSNWHTLLAILIFTAPGCFLAHGRETPAEPGPSTPEPIAPEDPDAGGSIGEPVPIDAGASDPCAPLFAALREDRLEEIGCDGRTFRDECALEVSPCCTVHIYCAIDPGDGGHLTAAVTCDDWCAQGCETYAQEGCALPGCEWFAPNACGPAPEGVIEGPRCIDPRGSSCSIDADCPAGERCLTYWIDPCAGSDCDACGGEELRCAR
jgi:hypothetical protein